MGLDIKDLKVGMKITRRGSIEGVHTVVWIGRKHIVLERQNGTEWVATSDYLSNWKLHLEPIVPQSDHGFGYLNLHGEMREFARSLQYMAEHCEKQTLVSGYTGWPAFTRLICDPSFPVVDLRDPAQREFLHKNANLHPLAFASHYRNQFNNPKEK